MTIYGSVLKYTLIAAAAILVMVSAYAASVCVSLYYRSEADLRAGVDLSERSTVTRLRELRGGAKGTPAELFSLFGWRAPRKPNAIQLKRGKGIAPRPMNRLYFTKEPIVWLVTKSPPLAEKSADEVLNPELVMPRKPSLGSLAPPLADTAGGDSKPDGDFIPDEVSKGT